MDADTSTTSYGRSDRPCAVRRCDRCRLRAHREADAYLVCSYAPPFAPTLHHSRLTLLLLHPLVDPFTCRADVASLIQAHGLQLSGADRLVDLLRSSADVRCCPPCGPPAA